MKYIFVILFFFLSGYFFSQKTNPKITGEIEIDEIPLATKSASFKLTVASYIFDDLEFFINDKSVKKMQVQPSDFVTELTGLDIGKNEVYILAKNSKTGGIMKSEEKYVSFETTKPKLVILSPNNNDTVNSQTVEIKGKTDADSFVLINENPVDYYKDGNFSSVVQLVEGENKIKVFSQDFAGNQTTKTISLNYQ